MTQRAPMEMTCVRRTPEPRGRPGASWRSLSMLLVLMLVIGLSACSDRTASTQALTPQDLVRKNGCMACHGMVHKQVGPGFAQVAERYRDDAEAPTRLVGKILHGSVGTWGRVIMPQQSLVTEADAQLLARWVLSQPSP